MCLKTIKKQNKMEKFISNEVMPPSYASRANTLHRMI